MNRRHLTLGLLASLSILVAGCAATQAATTAAAPGRSMSPGMVMSPGESMPGMVPTLDTPAPANDTAAAPSASARLVCGAEIKGDVAMILGLHPAPAATTTWTDHLYTCTYHLANGPLVISVKESPNVTTADTYFTALRGQLGTTSPLVGLEGLGSPGYDTPDGKVVVRKDDKTLQVDATGLPTQIGQHHQSRADLAYEVASDILGCWNGD
jgi:hypothetical protein